MCGITGWVAFDRDLTAERDVLEAMTATRSCPGPDVGGVHLEPRAALGRHRPEAVDVDGGARPLSVEHDGRPLAVLAFSGELYNHRELRASASTWRWTSTPG